MVAVVVAAAWVLFDPLESFEFEFSTLPIKPTKTAAYLICYYSQHIA